MRSSLIIGASVATIIAAGASAEITGAVTVDYVVTAEDFGGDVVTVNVSDLYLTSNDAADTALNVYNMSMALHWPGQLLPERDRRWLDPHQPRFDLRYRSTSPC